MSNITSTYIKVHWCSKHKKFEYVGSFSMSRDRVSGLQNYCKKAHKEWYQETNWIRQYRKTWLL